MPWDSHPSDSEWSLPSDDYQDSGIDSNDNGWGNQDGFVSPQNCRQFPDPESAIKTQLVAKQAELLNLSKEVKAKETNVYDRTGIFENAKYKMHKAGTQLAEDAAALVVAENKYDLLVEDIRSQTEYLEATRSAKFREQGQRTWEQCLIEENRTLKQKVESVQQVKGLLEDHCAYYINKIDLLDKDIDNLTLKNEDLDRRHRQDLLRWQDYNWEADPRVKEHVAAAVKEAVKEAVKKFLSCRDVDFGVVGPDIRASFIESHRVRDSSTSTCTRAFVPDGSKPSHGFDVLSDATLYVDFKVPGFRTDSDKFTRIYGINWHSALRLGLCPMFEDLVNKYALARSYCPQTFQATSFFKTWLSMGISFDDMSLEEVQAWVKNTRRDMFKTTMNLNLALAEMDRLYNGGRYRQSHDTVATRDESENIIIQQQAGLAIRRRCLEWRLNPHIRDNYIIEKGDAVAHYADALLDAIVFVPELLDSKYKPAEDAKAYIAMYHRSPIEVISIASHQSSSSLIKVINWFARIQQWHTSQDFWATKFYMAYHKFGLCESRGDKRDWHNWKPPRESSDWDHTLQTLESLYLEEEKENKRKHRRPESPHFPKRDQLRFEVGNISSKENHSPRVPIIKNDEDSVKENNDVRNDEVLDLQNSEVEIQSSDEDLVQENHDVRNDTNPISSSTAKSFHDKSSCDSAVRVNNDVEGPSNLELHSPEKSWNTPGDDWGSWAESNSPDDYWVTISQLRKTKHVSMAPFWVAYDKYEPATGTRW
ncbi:hypothetical protein SBOR_3636 [Sclerotinia borealis F-4128]|uniref:Uncharacterized protein n=1 Tax=Sclerotinia borealis (strain F-4128) TaxID=1432307 RepID=W9CMR7_SCLBF|nr:hypothetical protein SBOR_3636 [Sclerotinia borealis F-4128]